MAGAEESSGPTQNQLADWDERFRTVARYGSQRAIAADYLPEDIPRLVRSSIADRTPEELAAEERLLDEMGL
jgi:hypothetical protein